MIFFRIRRNTLILILFVKSVRHDKILVKKKKKTFVTTLVHFKTFFQ